MLKSLESRKQHVKLVEQHCQLRTHVLRAEYSDVTAVIAQERCAVAELLAKMGWRRQVKTGDWTKRGTQWQGLKLLGAAVMELETT